MVYKSTQRRWRLPIFIALGTLLLLGLVLWAKQDDLKRSLETASIPEAMPYQAPIVPVATTEPLSTEAEAPSPAVQKLPPEANLAVPFTAQAPHANWELPYGEFCEEASILMAMSYIKGQTIPDPDFADNKLLEIWEFEQNTLNFPQDVTIEETAIIIRELYNFEQTRLIENPTAQDIKQAVANGKLVIVPAAGQLLGNPFYQQPGPLYHMFVVKGYTNDGKFIVNDPGTRRGADFLYAEQVMMDAMHDWRSDRQIELGRKAVLVVG